jgi:hypothetical protein
LSQQQAACLIVELVVIVSLALLVAASAVQRLPFSCVREISPTQRPAVPLFVWGYLPQSLVLDSIQRHHAFN